MKLNEKFFGHQHFESGTEIRKWSETLRGVKPSLSQHEFAVQDTLPELPSDYCVIQIKYDGMLGIAFWDEQRQSFVVWGYHGRVYFSDGNRKHPVTEFFLDQESYKDKIFIGETYVIQNENGKAFMTPFNEATSILKNPKTKEDISRIRFVVFDIIDRKNLSRYPLAEEMKEFLKKHSYRNRWRQLLNFQNIPIGVDSTSAVHLPDHMDIYSAEGERVKLQEFWNKFIRYRGFEGFVIHAYEDKDNFTGIDLGGYKLKFIATLDCVIIGIKKTKKYHQAACSHCMEKLEKVGVGKLIRQGKVKKGTTIEQGDPCPLCGKQTHGMVGCVMVALMTKAGKFVGVGDVSKMPDDKAITYWNRLNHLYEDENYMMVEPSIVIEVSYADLYLDSKRPLYKFEDDVFKYLSKVKALSFRYPDFIREREDKTVNPQDLRLSQVSYYVKRAKRLYNIIKPTPKQIKTKTKKLDKWM